MFPGMGGMNPKKMQAMMKQLGVNQTDLDAERVVVEMKDGSKLVVEEPSVAKVAMGGAESLQVSGTFVDPAVGETAVSSGGDTPEDEDAGVSEEDVKMVMEKTGKSKKEVEKVLAEKDLAEAIVELSG
jgi:nascent polypeptide-associated complex subunit alpha